MLMIEKNITV